jgi:hypothetical protein
MWALLRTLVAIVFVLLILTIVVSPYVDLPLTDLRAQQAVFWLVSAVLVAWLAVAAACRPATCKESQVHEGRPGWLRYELGLLELNCALLC